MGKQSAQELLKKAREGNQSVSAKSLLEEARKKKEEPSSELPLQSQEEVSVSVGVEPPTTQGDTTAEQGKIEIPSVIAPVEYKEADFGNVNPAALYGDFQANERSLGQINQTLSKYEQAQSQVRTDDISFGRNTQADLSSEISQLKKDRQKIMEQQKNLSNRLLNPVVKEASQFYLNEDGSVKEQYYKENFYGMKVPNVEKINELVDERIEDKGLRVKLAEKIQGDIDFNLNIDQEKLASLAKEKIKSKIKDIQGEREELFESQYGKDVSNAYASALREIKSVSDIYGDEYKEKAIEIDSELKQITTDYEAYSTELKNKEYTTQEEVDQANQLLQKAYGDYQKSYSDAVTKNAQLLNAYNAKINKRAQEVQAIYQEKVNQMAEQFGKDNPIPPELIDKAYQEALSEQMAKVREVKEFVVSQGGLPLRFGTSTLSSFGSFIEMVGATFGGDGETGKQMQQYFQPAVDPIKGFRDLTLYNLVESSGNLAGSMIPSVVASAAAAATTRNLSTSARLLSTALAGFTSETADLMARSYRDALKRSGSVEEAKNAAIETFNSQLVLTPAYVPSALPFVGGIKRIKNPMLRFGANGLLEYTTETFLQEYPQNIMERAIAETGEYESAPSFASLESLQETAANTLATIPFGGATAAISSESTVTPTPDQFIQNLEKVLRNEGGDAANRLITELYLGGKITEYEMGMLVSILEDIDINNSEQYNAIRYRRDIVNEAISNEPDEAKKKKMKKYVKAYDDILERILGGEEVTIPKQKIGGQEYYSVPNNPISFLDNLNKKDNEKVQQKDQELREQEGEVKKEEERIRQEEQTRVLEEFDAVEDNETVTITSKTLEKIPEQFRDRAEKVEGVEVETKKTFLGIPYGKAESIIVGDGYRYNATGEEIRNAINQEEQTIVADEKASIKEPVLEKPQDGGVQKEGEQESPQLRTEKEEVTEDAKETPKSEVTGDNLEEETTLEQDINNIGYENPFNPRERIINDESTVEVGIFEGDIFLSSIFALNKGKGAGQRALKKVKDIADKHGVKIRLNPVPFGEGGMSESDLVNWYKKNGFSFEQGKDFGEMTYTPKKKYNLSSDKSRVVDKPDMENPIHGIRIGERDVFVQRLDGDGWFEVELDEGGVWMVVDGLNRFNDGDTKAEAIEALSKKYNTKQQTDAQEIREVRKEGKQEATQEESVGDLQEQPQTQEKVAPKDEVTVTYEAYNSKGKKVTKQRRGVVESVNDDGSYDIRAREGVYKGVKPIKINKVTKKPTVKSETKGLTEAEQAKQGLEEILAAKESKLAEIKQKLNDKIAQVKEKFKGKLSEEKQKQREDKAAQKELTKIINQEMRELGLGDLRRGRVSRLLSGLKNTKDTNFDQQLEKVYDALIQEAKGKRLSQYTKKAKKAAKRVSKSDFGTKANALLPLLRLDPKIIQDQDIVRYTEIVDALTQEGKYRVEDLDLIIDDALEIQQRAEDAIGTLEAEASQVAQGLTEDNFTSSVAKMLEDGVISEKLANFLTKNKRRLLGSESKPINRGQLEYEVKDRAEFVSNNKPKVEDSQVEDAVDTVVSVTQSDLDNLTPQQLSLLNRVLDAMEVGIVPSQVIRVARDITAFREASNINEELRSQKGVRGKITTVIETPLKTLFDTKRAKTEARVLKSQTPEIDAALGFKGRAIDDALRKFNLGYANFSAEKYRNDAQLATLLKGIRKNEESDIKAFMYMAELQSRSNPDSKKVHSVRELVEVLNKDARSRNEFIKIYGKKRLQSINEMLEQFKDEDGDLDVEAVYESMTKAEKKYVDGVRKILDDTTPKARAAAFMRSEPFEEFENYINYPVVSSMTRDKVSAAVESVMRGGNVNNMSTRSMLKERQVAVPPVSFSLAESVQNSYNETLKDYYLTDPLKTEFSALNKLSEMAKDEEGMSQVVEGIRDGIRVQRKHLLRTQATQGLNSKLYNQVTEAAYRYLLGSTQRFVAEGLSNALYVLTSDPNAFKEAIYLADKGLDIGEILQNTQQTTQRERVMGNAKFMGHADVASTFSEGVDFSVKRKDLDTKAAEVLKRAQDWWGLKVPESVPMIGGTKISPKAYQEEIMRSPDRFFARGVLFSAVKKSFKEQTGKDLDLMSLKDKDFVRQNKKVLREAFKIGDRALRKAFATTNPAERAGAQLKATEGAMGGRFKYFMLPFMINEYEQLRGAYIRDGFVGGATTSLPIMLRFATYGVIADVVSRMLLAPFTDDDEDIWDILPNPKEFGRSFLSAFVALTIQRNMSNFARVPMNVAIEILNDVFGEGVTREKGDDYNKYSNSVMYNKIDITELDKMSAFEASKVIMPQLSPFIGATETTWKAVDKYLENKDKMFLSKNKKDLETYYKYKAAIEVLASLGIITKDVRSGYVYYKNKDRIMKRGK
jgi:hypothetical protein